MESRVLMLHPNGDKFIVFKDRESRQGIMQVWSNGDGHGEAVIGYINQSKIIKNEHILALYSKLYDV